MLPVLEALLLNYSIHILQAINFTIIRNSLLVPESLSEGRILLIDVFNLELIRLPVFWIGITLRYRTKLILELELSDYSS